MTRPCDAAELTEPSIGFLQNIGHMRVPQDSKSLTGGQVVMAKAGTMHKDLQLNACPKSCELFSMDAHILRSMSLVHSTRSYAVLLLPLGLRKMPNDHRPYLVSSKRDI